MSYNRAILIGRLTADPELRTTNNGVNVASFRLAVDRPFGDHKADFISIQAWRQTGEFVCKYFHKGNAIGVEGSIQTGEYTDRDGNKRQSFAVVADKAFFVEGKKEQGEVEKPAQSNSAMSADDFVDDVPF